MLRNRPVWRRADASGLLKALFKLASSKTPVGGGVRVRRGLRHPAKRELVPVHVSSGRRIMIENQISCESLDAEQWRVNFFPKNAARPLAGKRTEHGPGRGRARRAGRCGSGHLAGPAARGTGGVDGCC